MNISIFDIKPWEKNLFSKALKKHKVTYFTEPIQKVNIKKLQKTEIISCFITSKLDKKIIDQLPSLKLVATRSTGFDHLDTKTLEKRAIKVMNVPSYGENTVAEHTFALILTLSRNIHQSYLRTLKNNFSIDGLKGFDLCQKTLGVIGTGRIGSHVVRIAKGFEMKVVAYDGYPNKVLAKQLDFKYVSLKDLLRQSDIITLQSVRFTGFQVGIDEKRSVVVSMRGQARDYQSVALQSDQLGKTKGIRNPVFSGLTLDTFGRVQFEVTFNVDPALVSYGSASISSDTSSVDIGTSTFPFNPPTR
jgi:hypothetical protein